MWAAGAAYLPLDPRQPELRLSYQVEDSGARLVIAASEVSWAGQIPVITVSGAYPVSSGMRGVCDISEGSGAASASGPGDGSASATGTGSTPGGASASCTELGTGAGRGFTSVPLTAGDLAYVIYTSGSTGLPKGVAVTHGNLANLVLDFAERLGLDAAAPVLWSTTTSFDISALELMLPLTLGATLVVASDGHQLQPREFLELVADRDVRVVQATPTAWRLIAPEAAGELAGRIVLCGGEPMPAALARDLLGLGCRLFNVYGPTETTIWSTAAELSGVRGTRCRSGCRWPTRGSSSGTRTGARPRPASPGSCASRATG